MKLKKSDNIVVIKRADGYLLYNSLFGMAVITDEIGVGVINEFSEWEISNNVIDKYDGEIRDRIKILINILYRKYLLVEEEIDEREIVEKEMKRRLKDIGKGEYLNKLQLVVSNICNFNCEYCFIKTAYCSDKRREIQGDPYNQMMKFSRAKQIIDIFAENARKNGQRNIVIQFFGGEPLCNYKVIREILDYYYENPLEDILPIYSIVTNASMINEEVAAKFGEFNVDTCLSFDMPDSDARTSKEDDSLKHMIEEKLIILKKYNVPVSISSTIASNILESFNGRKLVEFAKEYDVPKIVISIELNVDFYDDIDRVKLMGEKALETLYAGIENGIEITGTWFQVFKQIIGDISINMTSGYKACVACGGKLSVEPNGDIFPCKISSSYYGNIDNMEEVLNSKSFKDYSKNAYFVSKECRGCPIEGFCSGLCNGGKEKKFGDIFKVHENACELFKMITEDILMKYPLKNIDSYFIEE